MAYDKRKIANSFYLPKFNILHGIASILDFTRSESDEFAKELLARSDADAMRADWEAVGHSLWWSIGAYEKKAKAGSGE